MVNNPNIMTLISLEEIDFLGSPTHKKPRDDTEHLVEVDEEESILVPDVAEQVKNLKEIGRLCGEAKTLEARVKSMLRDYEKKNKYEKSPSHEKYQSKETTKKN
ncbi:hypothetical protein BASA84_001400 [Batrachochytrium salamandrivorans]|nr:hypothetical protein BASA84_001400 [Batrachochytrium salamandrivorans]